MRGVLAFGVAATVAVAAFVYGLNHGIRVGVEETTQFYRDIAPVCTRSTPVEENIPTS